jgi:hypothetical protein
MTERNNPTEEQIQEMVKKNRMPVLYILAIVLLLLFMRWLTGYSFPVVIV